MSSHEHIVVGTRGSVLALKQTDIVIGALKALHPALGVEVQVIQTQGDINHQPIPLDTIGKGWFTEEIETALLKKDIDLAVHSLKDMAEDMPPGLHIGAYLPREDARDVLITKRRESLEELVETAVIGTDSARRQVQMLEFKPSARMRSLRGNVPTRLEKLMSGDYDAIILAAAGLKRLNLEEKITRYFEPSEMTPAPGQGILAVQARIDDEKISALLASVNDLEAARAAKIERSFSRTVGGGCKAPTGAYAVREGDICVLTGMILMKDKSIVREVIRAPWEECEGLGTRLATKLLTAYDHEERV